MFPQVDLFCLLGVHGNIPLELHVYQKLFSFFLSFFHLGRDWFSSDAGAGGTI